MGRINWFAGMNESMEDRELIALRCFQSIVRGTHHKAHNGGFRSGAEAAERNRIGVVFVNSGFLPRSATGDSAVYWATSFAESGYPSFRLDLPALGDSDGYIPPDLYEFVNAGGYAPVLCAAVNKLVERYGLQGVVLAGHCAGAVTALYAAAASGNCKGLVLMDPYFFLPQRQISAVRQMLRDWAAGSTLGGIISDIYDRLRAVRLLLRGRMLPENANRLLLSRWRQLVSAGMPILILKAPGLKATAFKPRTGEFDYLSYVQRLAGHKSRVTVEFVEATDHSFANRAVWSAVQLHAETWLNAWFPLTDCQVGAAQTELARPAGA